MDRQDPDLDLLQLLLMAEQAITEDYHVQPGEFQRLCDMSFLQVIVENRSSLNLKQRVGKAEQDQVSSGLTLELVADRLQSLLRGQTPTKELITALLSSYFHIELAENHVNSLLEKTERVVPPRFVELSLTVADSSLGLY